MKILKFGGTSVATPENIKRVANIVCDEFSRSGPLVVVCSAQGGVTNRLIEASQRSAQGDESYRSVYEELVRRHEECARELGIMHTSHEFLEKNLSALEEILRGVFLLKECTPRSKDLIMSFGERLSTFLICEFLRQREPAATMLDTRFVVKTDNQFGNARVQFEETYHNIRIHCNDHTSIRVVTGFIGSTAGGDTTTLGRGGSDYTASLFGAALGADEIQIWTDVNGILTADPRLVQGVASITDITYEEAMEMSHFGAKVIYPPTMQPARETGIPIVIKNTFEPDHPGTRIHAHALSDGPIKGISSIQRASLILVSGSGMVGVTGIAGRMFSALAEARINIIMITQGSSEHSICAVVSPEDTEPSLQAITEAFKLEILQRQIDDISAERDVSVIAVIGERMRQVVGMAGKIFQALGDHGVNVIAIAQGSSERNISIVVHESQVVHGMQAIHDRFFANKRAPLQVALVGAGVVGKALLQQRKDRMGQDPEIALIAVAHSRHMLFHTSGVNEEALDAQGEPTDLPRLVHWLKHAQFPHPVFVDCTASDEPVQFYEELLRSGVSVATSNKRATSGGIEMYRRLKNAARGATFCYETNVGAGLPVIGVIKSLLETGDYIHKIQGTLSGTLSYLFNTFEEGMSFTQLLRQAREKGYTEPDPRDDLSGMDVARKLLILAREIGLSLELNDIEVENLVPEDCRKVDGIEAFFARLVFHDALFSDRLAQAKAQGKVLRYVAQIQDGRAGVRLEAVGPGHPCYGLSGSDNLISFTSDRYRDHPLVVRGPGAGADVTAAGVLADILSCSR